MFNLCVPGSMRMVNANESVVADDYLKDFYVMVKGLKMSLTKSNGHSILLWKMCI